MFYRGDIRVLYIKIDGVFTPIGCLTSNPFSEDVDMLSTNTRNNEGWRTSLPTTQGFTIGFEGLQVRNDEKLSYLELKKLKRNRQRIEWQIGNLEETFLDTGFGYITSIGETNGTGDVLSFSGEIVGYGIPTIIELDGDLWQDGETMIFQDGIAFQF